MTMSITYNTLLLNNQKNIKERRHRSPLEDVFTLPPLLAISGVFPPPQCVTPTALVALTGRQVFGVFQLRSELCSYNTSVN